MALRDDLIYAARSLRKTPGLVSVVVLTLALGIGVNSTAFNLLNLLVLAPPSAKEPGRLLRIEPGNSNLISYLNFRDLPGSSAFAGMALESATNLNWRNGDGVEPVRAMVLSANFFSMAGTSPWLGRAFTAEEAAPERNPNVVVLSYEFWERRFERDRDVLGRTLNINGRPFTVIGVMGRGYRIVMGGMFPQMFVPIGPAVTSGLENRQASGFSLIARLRPGVGREQARLAFTTLAKALEKAYPRENANFGAPAFAFPVSGLGSLQERNPHPEFFIGLAAPFVVAGLLLLIACANVAGVMLARGAMRQREIAVRLALGASRAHVTRLLLADSFLLSILGGAGALLVTAWLTPLLAQVRIPNTPVLPPFSLQMDVRLALFMLAVSFATVLLCGLVPARQSSRPHILPCLKQSVLPGRRSSGLSRFLVSAQVAVSALLLVVCLLFLHSLLNINKVDPGFDIGHGITASVTPEQKNLTSGQLYALAEELVTRVKTVPGVESASFASLIPLAGDSFAGSVRLRDRPDFRSPLILFNNVGPAYFRTMGIRILGGREFQTSDRQGAPAVAIVNETFARLFFPRGDALGKVVRLGGEDAEPWREVVGVVADNKYEFYAETPKPQLFSPFLQTGGRIFLQVRTAGAPDASVAAVRRIIADMDRSLVADVRITRDATSLEFVLRRIGTELLAAMGTLGVILSMIGLYGVISWDVSRRIPEIGIRMALGASRGQVRRMVLGTALVTVGCGVGTGICAAMLMALPLRSFLAGVRITEPVTIGAVAALLMLVSLAASWFPVRRATRVDPIAALRYE
jgi:putative ABC transport system permease protein